MHERIVRCASCDGYGWLDADLLDDLDGADQAEAVLDCDWCGGGGYVYRDDRGVERRIPDADYPKLAATLEQLERERMRDIGYTGSAKHPTQQAIRQQHPPADPPDDGDN
ncbi:MAG: hypothetical protein GYB67_14660 [Chloroflexi bacterium]|nr:hypothetical protein [Chloroflexota bacterium]